MDAVGETLLILEDFLIFSKTLQLCIVPNMLENSLMNLFERFTRLYLKVYYKNVFYSETMFRSFLSCQYIHLIFRKIIRLHFNIMHSQRDRLFGKVLKTFSCKICFKWSREGQGLVRKKILQRTQCVY